MAHWQRVCWKWDSIRQILVGIAEGKPQPGDVEFAEEGLQRHPELQRPMTAVARGLEVAHLQQAAQRVRTVQANARRNASNPRSSRDEGAQSQAPGGDQMQAPRVQEPPGREPCREQLRPRREQAHPGRV